MSLSEREKACLLWTARGKSSWEIGRILSISENTVAFARTIRMYRRGADWKMAVEVLGAAR
jgi:DNA-binding CsgD family transcriptional regulator